MYSKFNDNIIGLEEKQYFVARLNEAFEVFESKLFSSGEAMHCKMHSFFTSTNTSSSHNCIGCNLASALDILRNQLRNSVLAQTKCEAFSIFILNR